VTSAWSPGDLIFTGYVGGDPTTVQSLKRDGQKLHLVFCGTNLEVSVRDAAHQRFFANFKEYEDTVNLDFIVTPMPGIVVSTHVNVGDSVCNATQRNAPPPPPRPHPWPPCRSPSLPRCSYIHLYHHNHHMATTTT
jgi:hypothetical protein